MFSLLNDSREKSYSKWSKSSVKSFRIWYYVLHVSVAVIFLKIWLEIYKTLQFTKFQNLKNGYHYAEAVEGIKIRGV